MAVIDYNLADVAPNPNARIGGGAVVPGGLYQLCVADTSYSQNNSRTGMVTGVKVEVLDGGPEAQGQKVWLNFNTSNKNESHAAEQRALFAAIVCACGVDHRQLRDTAMIHGRIFSAQLRKEPAKGDFPAKNSVEKVMLSQDQIAAAQGQSAAAQQMGGQQQQQHVPQQQQPQQNGGQATPPWAA